MDLFKGVLGEKELSLLKRLTYNREAEEIVAYISKITRAFRAYSILFTITQAIQFILFAVIIAFQDNTRLLETGIGRFFVFALCLISIAAVVTRVLFSSRHNKYHRIVRLLLDNYLDMVFTQYRLSLAESIHTLPKTQIICAGLGEAGVKSADFFSSLSVIPELLLLVVLLIFKLVFAPNIYTGTLLIIALITIILMALIFWSSKKYTEGEEAFNQYNYQMDISLRNSKDILMTTSTKFVKENYEKNLSTVINATTLVNFLLVINKIAVPVLVFLIPIFITAVSPTIYLSLVVITNLMALSTIGSQIAAITQGEKGKHELVKILETVIANAAELTENTYKDVRIVDKGTSYETMRHKDLLIRNLTYTSGRKGQERQITAKALSFPNQKVSIITGDSGTGKSILGRILSLRYRNFDAAFIGQGAFDFRMFETIETAHKELLFSGIREINTSYRGAISEYISSFDAENFLLKKLLEDNIPKDILQHFEKNREYYGALQTKEIAMSDTIRKLFTNKQKTSQLIREKIAYIYNNLRDHKIIKRVLSQSAQGMELYQYCLLAEYYAFKHLQSFIPECSLYFVDAILSEPPISQGQRRRIVYALDRLLKSSVFIVDEPTSNLDLSSRELILSDIALYTQQNNTVSIIIEPNLEEEIIKYFERMGILGNIYAINKENGEIETYKSNIKRGQFM